MNDTDHANDKLLANSCLMQQASIWTNVDTVLYRQMVSLGHIALTHWGLSNNIDILQTIWLYLFSFKVPWYYLFSLGHDGFTHFGLVTPLGDTGLGQRRLR